MSQMPGTQSELYWVTKSFNIQTSETTRSVIELASQETSKSSKEKVLQGYGLHDIRVGRSDKILFYLSGTENFSTFMELHVLGYLHSNIIRHFTFG